MPKFGSFTNPQKQNTYEEIILETDFKYVSQDILGVKKILYALHMPLARYLYIVVFLFLILAKHIPDIGSTSPD